MAARVRVLPARTVEAAVVSRSSSDAVRPVDRSPVPQRSRSRLSTVDGQDGEREPAALERCQRRPSRGQSSRCAPRRQGASPQPLSGSARARCARPSGLDDACAQLVGEQLRDGRCSGRRRLCNEDLTRGLAAPTLRGSVPRCRPAPPRGRIIRPRCLRRASPQGRARSQSPGPIPVSVSASRSALRQVEPGGQARHRPRGCATRPHRVPSQASAEATGHQSRPAIAAFGSHGAIPCDSREAQPSGLRCRRPPTSALDVPRAVAMSARLERAHSPRHTGPKPRATFPSE